MFWNELVLKFLLQNKKIIFFYIITTILIFPLESVVLPKIYGKLFESIKTQNLPNLMNYVFKNIKNYSSTGIIWSIIIIWVFLILLKYINNIYDGEITGNSLSFIREKIFSKTLDKFSTQFKEINGGKYITRLLNISRYIRDIITSILTVILPISLAIFCIILYFLFTDRNIGYIMFIGIVLTIVILLVMGRKCIQYASEREMKFFNVIEKISDNFDNLMNIYLNNESHKEINKNDKLNNINSEEQVKQLVFTQLIVTIITIISTCTFFSIIILNYKLLSQNKITPQYFTTIFMIMIYYFSYLLKLSNNLPWIFNKIGVVKSSEPLLNYIFNTSRQSLIGKKKIKNGEIVFKNIYFKYPKTNNYILEDINLTIKAKEKICLIGPSGAGKSTLVKLLLRMNVYDKGDIYIDNINIKNYPINYIRDQITYLNQKTSLFNKSVFENISYGNKHVKKNEVLDIIKKYNITNYHGLKNGIDENAGVNGANLSLGMQKITILLRGIFKNDTIKIFDEPLAGLDSETRASVIKMIENECKNKTIIIITHDKEILPYCTKEINIKEIKNLKPNRI